MRSYGAISALLFSALFAVASTPACADNTDHQTKSEYILLGHGFAPNSQMSLASRGEGALRTFQVWLMAEPTHRKITVLPGIVETYHDSALEAVWSEDSRNVADSWYVVWGPFLMTAGAFVLGVPVYLAQRKHMTAPADVPTYV